MKVTVLNEAYNGGDSRKYDITMLDATTGKSCGLSGAFDFNIGTPRYADFIVERPLVAGGLANLPQFGDFPLEFILGSFGPIESGWYVQDTMVNNGNTNATCFAYLDSLSNFTSYAFQYHWVSSQGT